MTITDYIDELSEKRRIIDRESNAQYNMMSTFGSLYDKQKDVVIDKRFTKQEILNLLNLSCAKEIIKYYKKVLSQKISKGAEMPKFNIPFRA